MTARCVANGPSSAKPGFERFLSVAPYAVSGLLTELPPVAAAAIGAGIGNQFYDLSTFCATDPPAMPTITALDVAALFNPVFSVLFNPAADKFRDLIANYAWNAFCQCNSGAQPPRPTLPPALLDYNPNPSTGPVPTTGDGCFDQLAANVDVLRDAASFAGNGSSPQGREYTLTHLFLTSPETTHTFTGGFSPPQLAYRAPAGATHVELRITIRNPVTRLQSPAFGVYGWNAAGQNLGGFSNTNVPNVAGTYVRPTSGPAALNNSVGVIVGAAMVQGDPTVECDLELVFFCGSTQPAIYQPCCPPDPTLSQAIQRVLNYVELIQRQVAPFGYVTGSSHAGLSGAGHIDVQGLIGARVDLTTTPVSVGLRMGDPTRVEGAGWINWGNSDGSTERQLVTSDPFVSFPAVAGQYTRIGYSLEAGVVATITELVREP